MAIHRPSPSVRPDGHGIRGIDFRSRTVLIRPAPLRHVSAATVTEWISCPQGADQGRGHGHRAWAVPQRELPATRFNAAATLSWRAINIDDHRPRVWKAPMARRRYELSAALAAPLLPYAGSGERLHAESGLNFPRKLSSRRGAAQEEPKCRAMPNPSRGRTNLLVIA